MSIGAQTTASVPAGPENGPHGEQESAVEFPPGIDVALTATATVAGETESRVGFTPAAVELIRQLWESHGALMFHQSGGCCDGSAPMCFPAGEFRTGDSDVLLGVADLTAQDGSALGPVEFWISAEQFEAWRRTRLVIDAVPGRGSGFSLETPTGKRFLTRSELCSV
ncbi:MULTISPECIES: DUF779 domain-containing protein [Kocuria]|uniref:UDP-glucose 4-epimerase n=1 Tax=Kocuria varians TaxID=1272 RepID=A0A7D7KZ27_KOCVA|nr:MULTISPECIES: DUF779 domain-containing protein [Kocuria]MDN5631540.1 DUF779 domain-containing protein [Kocuria sp.]QMS56685.1 hypothetical protein CIB50_0001399 [Kocuria varians]RUP83537.1 DUF779 domain-containing protein [Kocuria sp. HSID17590]RUQ09072.1 DUF779 domain-containing protein [Kocuria sp. HSID17582]